MTSPSAPPSHAPPSPNAHSVAIAIRRSLLPVSPRCVSYPPPYLNPPPHTLYKKHPPSPHTPHSHSSPYFDTPMPHFPPGSRPTCHTRTCFLFSDESFFGIIFSPPPPPPWQLILIVLVPVALALVLPNLAPKTSNVGGVPSCGGYGLYLPYECAASGLLVIITTMLCAFIVVFFTLLMSPLPCASALGECGQ